MKFQERIISRALKQSVVEVILLCHPCHFLFSFHDIFGDFWPVFHFPAREKFLLSAHRCNQIREIAEEKLNWSLPLFLCSHIIWRWIQKCLWRTWQSQNSQVCKTWFWVEICTIANVFNNVTPIRVWIHLWNLTGVTAKWFSVKNSAENIASVWVEILDVQDPQSDGKHGKWQLCFAQSEHFHYFQEPWLLCTLNLYEIFKTKSNLYALWHRLLMSNISSFKALIYMFITFV
jgi:hypothetical protein